MTQVLHELTTFLPGLDWFDPQPDERLVHSFASNDPQLRPPFFKRYSDDLPRVVLPRELLTLPSTSEVLAGVTSVPPRPLTLDAVSTLLYLSAGVTRVMRRKDGGEFPLRAAGSAGARFPLELYLAVPAGTSGDVAPGVHWYDPSAHALVAVGPPPEGDDAAVIVTGVPWRTGWRYRERGYRHIYWDAGTALSHLLSLSDALGLGGELFPTFPDAAVSELVGCNGVAEFPVTVLGLGGRPALIATGAAATGDLDDRIEFPLVTAAQRAGDGNVLGPPWSPGAPVDPVGDGTPLDQVLLARSSYRRLDPSRGVSRQAMEGLLRSAMRGVDVPHYVAVNDVTDTAPGLYRWPDLDTPVRTGDLRGELYEASTQQGLPRDAAFVVISAVDGAGLSDRGYRDAQLLAGLVLGRLHILAPLVAAGANGMTFDDRLVPELLGATDLDPLLCLVWTCVGVPEYRPKSGGRPDAPSEIRMVEPRMDDGPVPPTSAPSDR